MARTIQDIPLPTHGTKAIRAFLKALPEKDGSRELWLKLGHSKFYWAEYTQDGDLHLRESFGGEGKPRTISTTLVPNGVEYLYQQSLEDDGGVFWCCHRPVGEPLAACVGHTERVVIELDHVDPEFQLKLYAEFEQVSGLKPWGDWTSGGKSVHRNYLMTVDDLTLRRLLTLALQADPTLLNLHQPARIPGFYRREKGKHQELLTLNPDAVYPPEQVEAGLQFWFNHLGWKYPERVSEAWWSGRLYRLIRPVLVEQQGLTFESQREAIREALEQGCDAWEAEQEAIARQHAAESEARRTKYQPGSAGETLVNLVKQTEQRMTIADLNLYPHGWKGKGSKGRGDCCFHDSASKSSAWAVEGIDGVTFSCQCLGTGRNGKFRKIGAFEYWYYLTQCGGDTRQPYPVGKAYVEAAIDFLRWAGVYIPAELLEFKPRKQNTGDRTQGITPKPVPKDIYRLSFMPDIEVCDRYFPDIPIPSGVKLVGVKGAKGVGKTEWLIKIVKQAHAEGRRVLLLTFREQLGMQSAARLGIPYLVEVRLKSNKKGVALCWDSAHPASAIAFEGEDWHDADVVIDESESVLWHGLNSSTCAKNRQAILKQIQILLSGALAPDTKGRVFCLDADLSDISLETVRSLGCRPELQPYIILNTYQIQKGKLYHYASNEELLSKCEGELAAGGKHIVLVGAQKASSKYSSTNLEKRWKQQYPGKKLLRIDSKTIADPEHPGYLCSKTINRVLLDYDIVIVTSVLECGVSIDIYDHFSGVWGFFGAGVLAENSVRQFLSRLRDFEVPRHCHFAEVGCNFAYVGDRSCDPKALIESEIQLNQKNSAALLLGGVEVDVDGSIQTNAAALTAWGKFGARLNSTFANYRAVILAGLEAEGYQIEQIAPVMSEPELDALKDEIKALRMESHVEQAEAVSTLGDEPQSEREYELLKEKKSKTEAEHCAERRYELRQRYGLPVTPELVLRDDNGWFNFLRVQYLLTVSDQALVSQESSRLETIVYEGKFFAPDVNRRSVYAKVQLLRKLGATVLLNPEREFTGESPEVQLTAAIALANAAEVKLVLGITVTEKSTAMTICQEILRQTVGFGLKFQQRRVDGKAVRFYSYAHCLKDKELSVELAERQRVLAAWREREEQRNAEVSHKKLNKILLTDSSATCDGVTDCEAWFEQGAIEDAKATLDDAPDAETRAVVLELLPEHIRAVVTRDRPQVKRPGDRPQRQRTTPRPTHLQVVSTTPDSAPAPTFRVGDRVRLSSEKFEMSERKDVIRELGELLGQSGNIVRVEWLDIVCVYRYHIAIDGQVVKYPDVYLSEAVEVVS